LQKLNLGGAQVDNGVLNLHFILDAQQLDAVQIDLRDVAGAKTIAADGDDLVVVFEVGPGQIQHRLGLQSIDEGRAQIEEKIALQILML
jgi:hypothetical protein